MTGNRRNHQIENLPDVCAKQPEYIWIEPTTRCNTRCRHCLHFRPDFHGVDMTPEIYEKIPLGLFKEPRIIYVTGYGESLVAPLFPRIFKDCQSTSATISLTTNGILLADDALMAQLVRTDMRLTLSIDGARKETFEFVRPFIKWESMLKVLENVKKHADLAGKEKRFVFEANFVLMKKNVDDLPDMVRLAARYGIEEILLFPLSGEDCKEKEMHDQSLRDAPGLLFNPLRDAMRLAAKHGVRMRIPAAFREALTEPADAKPRGAWKSQSWLGLRHLGYYATLLKLYGLRKAISLFPRAFEPSPKAGARYCTLPWTGVYFATNGAVHPCCVMSEVLGHLKEQPWEEIWNGPRYRSLRRTIHSWNPSYGCRYCGLSIGINGGNHLRYDSLFSDMKSQRIPLTDPGVRFGKGFYEIEYDSKREPNHVCMGLRGAMSVRLAGNPRFLRLRIYPRLPVRPYTSGRLRISGGEWEPFDTTCEYLHLPIPRHGGGQMAVEIEMEETAQTPPDTRDIALVIREIHMLQ